MKRNLNLVFCFLLFFVCLGQVAWSQTGGVPETSAQTVRMSSTAQVSPAQIKSEAEMVNPPNATTPASVAQTTEATSIATGSPTATPVVMPTTNSNANPNQPAAPVNGTLTADHPIYTLQLNSNPTTGYSWFLISYPSDFLTITKHEFIPPKNNMPGAGGVEMWQFTAKPEAFLAPHVFTIQMTYARPWEINDQTIKQNFYIVTR